MGRNKMLLQLDGQSLARRAATRAAAAGLAPVVVVLGHEAEMVRADLAGLPCRFVVNPGYDGPTSGSLHCGLEALPDGAGATVIMLADMPFVTVEMLAALAAVPRTANARLAASRYGAVLAPPLLFRRPLFAELLAWHGEGCGKQVVLAHQDEAVFLDWPEGALADLDTPDDVAAFRQAAT